MTTGQNLLDELTNYAVSLGYKVVVRDTSSGHDAIAPSLVFLKGPGGATYSVQVEAVGQ